MFNRANLIFTGAFLFVLVLLIATIFIPAKIVYGMPVMMWFWLAGMFVFGLIIRWGVKCRDG